MKVSIFSVFWSNNNQERLRNINFTKQKIEELCSFINQRGIETTYTIFDFSMQKNIENSIHLPYNPLLYHRSKKVNMSIKYLLTKQNPTIICQLDSDIFVDESYYENFYNLLLNVKTNEFYIAQVLDIDENSLNNFDFINNKVNIQSLNCKPRFITGLGAVFITTISNIIEIGGFDERFEIWGGEDDDLADRLLRNGKERKVCQFNYYHLPHQSLESDAKKNKKYQEQVNIWKSDKTILRPSFINNYKI
jgi:hypothetical protein